MTDGGPFRTPGADRLGAVAQTFSTPPRQRFVGSARVVQRAGLLRLGAMAVPTARSTTLSVTRGRPGDTVEVRAGGLRVRTRPMVLELAWDQIVGWTKVEHAGQVVAIELRGSHGEQVRFDRNLRGLDDLYALVAARRASPP
ncbi:MAG: hypothetical protein R3B06_25100 [Kofleriaceae bacterium]